MGGGVAIFYCIFATVLDYGWLVWDECSKEKTQRLERLQNQAMRTSSSPKQLAGYFVKRSQRHCRSLRLNFIRSTAS